MSENQSNDVQDPSEQYKVDVAVETTSQPEPSDAGNDETPTEVVTETHEVTETVTETPADNG